MSLRRHLMTETDPATGFAAAPRGRFALVLERLHKARRELFWVAAGQGLAFLGGFAGIKVLTNMMGPESYGQLALGMTISGVLNMFVFGPVGQAVSRFYSRYRERNDLGGYFFLFKKIHLVSIAAIVCAAAPAAFAVYLRLGAEWALLVAAASAFGIVTGVNSSFLSLQSAARQRKVVALHQGADACLRPALAVTLLYFFRNSGYWALTGYLLGTLLVTISQWFFAMRNADIRAHFGGRPVTPEKTAEHLKELAEYSLPFAAFAAFGAASMYSDRWILQLVVGMREVGIYAAVSQIAAAPITLAAGMITQLMVPVIFDKAGDLKSREQFEAGSAALNATLLISGVLMAVICAAVFVFAGPILTILTTAEFASHSALLGVIAAGVSVFNLAQILCIKGNYTNKPHVYFWPKAGQALVSLVLGYLGAGAFGVMGVGYALCASSLVYLALVALANTRLRAGPVTVGVNTDI